MLERVRKFLFHPVKAFSEVKEDTLSDAFKYFMPLLFILAVILAVLLFAVMNVTGMSQIISMLPMPFTVDPAIVVLGGVFLCVLLGGFLLILYGSVWLHIWVLIFGGRDKRLKQSFKVVAYGSTPVYVLGWLPGPNILMAPVWTIIAWISGVMQLHEITSGRAIFIVIVSVIVPLIALGVMACSLMPFLVKP